MWLYWCSVLPQTKSQSCYLVEPPQEFDEEGKELGPDAQVWKTYVKEADRVDEELVDGWNKSVYGCEPDFRTQLSALLGAKQTILTILQAALFSAISTAFVIESYKNLKQDPADVSAQTLLVISQTLSSLANASQPVTSNPVPTKEAAPFRASASAICVNVLWFLSLSLSVAVNAICRDLNRENSNRYVRLLRDLPFPLASTRLIDLLSTHGVFDQLLRLLDDQNHFKQAFAAAQIWLLFYITLQVPDRTSNNLSKLETMLLEYPGLEHDLGYKQTVMEDLELKLLGLVDHIVNTIVFSLQLCLALNVVYAAQMKMGLVD